VVVLEQATCVLAPGREVDAVGDVGLEGEAIYAGACASRQVAPLFFVSAPPWRLLVAARRRVTSGGCPKKAAAAVIESFQAIVADPRRLGKPLRLELEGLWSARRGRYRVIYRIDDEERIVTVSHRGRTASETPHESTKEGSTIRVRRHEIPANQLLMYLCYPV
jgi:mRNA-degrading endonuclease RelE of RelBE toxin-antitoxin system